MDIAQFFLERPTISILNLYNFSSMIRYMNSQSILEYLSVLFFCFEYSDIG
jgi:hypothetical protein